MTYSCETCGEDIGDIVELVNHGCTPVRLSAESLARSERNTLLYAEHRVVDKAGKLATEDMNHEDHQNLKVFQAAGLLLVDDATADPDNPREDIRQVREFTDEAWDLARDCRQMRAEQDDRVDFPVA